MLREMGSNDSNQCVRQETSAYGVSGVKMVLVTRLTISTLLNGYVLCALIFSLTTCLFGSCQGRARDQRTLQERIEALNDESLGTMSLGKGQAHPTDNTEFIIWHQNEAVPLLVEALKDEKKPVKVGYAAYILRRIDSDKGKEAAAETFNKLSPKGSGMSVEERFAFGELKEYLDQVNKK